MEKKLYIEKWRPESEPRDVKYESVGYYYDIKTGIGIQSRKIAADLEVGQLYDFTFEGYNDTDTYTYLILKKENDLYYMAQYYDGLYKPNPKYLGDAWLKCDIKASAGIDLEEWMNFKPHQNYEIPDMRKKIHEYVSELDEEIKRCEKLAEQDMEDAKTVAEMFLVRIHTLTEVKNDLLSRLTESV